jgi:hypothetical protein
MQRPVPQVIVQIVNLAEDEGAIPSSGARCFGFDVDQEALELMYQRK